LSFYWFFDKLFYKNYIGQIEKPRIRKRRTIASIRHQKIRKYLFNKKKLVRRRLSIARKNISKKSLVSIE